MPANNSLPGSLLLQGTSVLRMNANFICAVPELPLQEYFPKELTVNSILDSVVTPNHFIYGENVPALSNTSLE